MSTPLLPCARAVASLLVLTSAAIAQCSYTWPAAPFGGGCDDAIDAVTVADNGDVVVGGRFTTAGGTAAAGIARWDGSAWTALGTGMNGEVRALATLPNGDVIAGGSFTTAGGVTSNGLARWNGSSWSAFGSGFTGDPLFGAAVNTIAVMPNGDLVVGGFFSDAGNAPANNVARWDGALWSAVGGGLDGVVRSLVVLPGGDLLAAGGFVTASATTVDNIARWDGSSWLPVGAGLGPFASGITLAVDANGTAFIGGAFTTAGGIPANGIAQAYPTWAAVGSGLNGPVTSILTLPSGDLVVGGLFTQAGGAAANGIARWDGSSWSSLGSGITGIVLDLALDASRDVIPVGDFTAASGGNAGRIARVHSSCAPQATSIGSGCSGSGGLNTLVATRLPMIGSDFEGTGTGLVQNSFVLAITGLQVISLPLAPFFPQAFPNCTAQTDVVLSQLLTVAGGEARSVLPFPNVASIVGLSFNHQFAGLEFDALFNITGISTTNGLQVTLGTF